MRILELVCNINQISLGTVTMNRTLGCTGLRLLFHAAPRSLHGDGWRRREMKGCRNDVRSQSAPLAAGKEDSWKFRPLLLIRNGAEIALGVSWNSNKRMRDDSVWTQMDDGIGEGLVLRVRAPQGDILRSDHISVLSLFVSPKLWPRGAQKQPREHQPGDGGAAGMRLDVEAAGWRRRARGAEEEPVDLRVASGLQGCISRCCLPSLWPSSV